MEDGAACYLESSQEMYDIHVDEGHFVQVQHNPGSTGLHETLEFHRVFRIGSPDDNLLWDDVDDPSNLPLVSLIPPFAALEVLNSRIRSISPNERALLSSRTNNAQRGAATAHRWTATQ